MTSPDSRLFRTSRLRGLLSRAVAEERGISLLLALLTLIVLGTLGSSVAIYTTSHLHSTYNDQSAANSYQLAEAGLNDAISRLEGASDPTDTTLLPSTTVTYTNYGGSVTYAGNATTTTAPDGGNEVAWTITSTGTAGSTSHLTRKRTLTQSLVVRGLVPGGDLGSWSRFYQDSDSAASRSTPSRCRRTSRPRAASASSTAARSPARARRSTSAATSRSPARVSRPAPTRRARATGWTNPTNVYTSNSVYATNVINAARHRREPGHDGLRLRDPVHREDPRDRRLRPAAVERVLQRRADDHGDRQSHRRHLHDPRNPARRLPEDVGQRQLQLDRRPADDRADGVGDVRQRQRVVQRRPVPGNRRSCARSRARTRRRP